MVDPDRGGPEGLAAVSKAARAAGMGVLVDIVPNHVGVASPVQNPWWWSLLKEGRGSRYAEAFDVDWDLAGGRIRLPVLGSDDDLDQLEIKDGELRYYDHRFPLAEGSYAEGDSPRDVHGRQHYELIGWRRADNELNYRRFFAVNTLAGIRVEVPSVFDEAHEEVVRWFNEGLADGLRIDHPDGLADPEGYLDGSAKPPAERTCWSRRSWSRGSSCRPASSARAPPATTPSPTSTGSSSIRRRREALDRLDAQLRGGEAADYAGHDPRHQAADHRRHPALGDPAAGQAGAWRRRDPAGGGSGCHRRNHRRLPGLPHVPARGRGSPEGSLRAGSPEPPGAGPGH